jgi:hypothetical protein
LRVHAGNISGLTGLNFCLQGHEGVGYSKQLEKEASEMRRGLCSYEQETIINFNKDEAVAHIFTYEKAWQQHLEKRLGLKPTMDNGFGGKGYEIDKKRIRPPRAPVKLSAEARAKRAEQLRQSRVLSARKPYAIAKSEAKKQNEGNTINRRLRTMK